MPRTPDRFPGTRCEDELFFEDNPGVPAGTGHIRYDGSGFVAEDSIGVFNLRTAGSDDPNSLFNDLNESYDLSFTEVAGLITEVFAHAPGVPANRIRAVDNMTCDAAGIINGMRLRQYADDGTTVIETLTYNGTGWVKT